MNGAVKALGLALALGLCAPLSGCKSAATKVIVQSTERTNSGNVLHMMVRRVDAKTASTAEEYQEMAVMLFAQTRDETVVTTEPVFPGRLTSLAVEEDGEKSFVLYFFFTSPGENWRVQLPKPLPAEVYVDLGQNQIDRIQVRR